MTHKERNITTRTEGNSTANAGQPPQTARRNRIPEHETDEWKKKVQFEAIARSGLWALARRS